MLSKNTIQDATYCSLAISLILKMERPIKLMVFFYVTFFSVVTAQPWNNLTSAQFHVGVILDSSTLVGKIGQTSIAMAVEDFYKMHENYRTRLMLHGRDANSDDLQASSAGVKTFIDTF